MTMSSEVAVRYFQGKENVPIAIARRRIKTGGTEGRAGADPDHQARLRPVPRVLEAVAALGRMSGAGRRVPRGPTSPPPDGWTSRGRAPAGSPATLRRWVAEG